MRPNFAQNSPKIHLRFAWNSLKIDTKWTRNVLKLVNYHFLLWSVLFFSLQNLKNQIMTTNMWVEQVSNSFGTLNTVLLRVRLYHVWRFLSVLILLLPPCIDVAVQRRNGWTTNWNGTPMTTAASRRSTFPRKIYGCPISSSTTSTILHNYDMIL